MEKLPIDQMKMLRILLVDDDSFALRIIRHILYGLGVGTIKEAFNGSHAVNILNKHEFDILITDVEMPKLNGLELLQQVRSGKTNASRDLASIVVTTFSETEILGSILALDVNGFLTKPIKQIWVHEKITKALTEGGYIRPATEYEVVETRLPGLRKKSESEKKSVNASISPYQQEKTESKAESDANKLFIRDLKAGMRLKGDLKLKDGTLLLADGYSLTKSTINRLNDIRQTLESEKIAIHL